MSLSAGAAVRDISPAGPVQLAGYPHQARLATGIHDPLLASVLYLEDGGSALLLGSIDVLMLNSDTARHMRRRVAAVLGIGESAVFLGCTHTHSGPSTVHYLPFDGDPALPEPDPAWLERLKVLVVQAALRARRDARSASLAWISAEAPGVGGNRRSPQGVTDAGVRVLAVRSPERWIAIDVIFGMHPTVLHEDSTLVSADFPGAVRDHLRHALADDLAVLHHTAPCGDQSPRHMVRGQTFAEAERLGSLLGAVVHRSLASARFLDDVPLASTLQAVDLPRRPIPSVDEARRDLERKRDGFATLRAHDADRGLLRTAEVAVFGAEGTLALARAHLAGRVDPVLSALQPIEVQAMRIGDGCLVGIPGEMFVEHSMAIKRRAPPGTAVVSFVNGELQGYIVTPDAVAEGGYEAAGRLFEPDAGRVLGDAAITALRHLERGT